MSWDPEAHLAELRACRRCPSMIGPVITGRPNRSRVYLLGQAPGRHEGEVGRPFGWTAGRTLFAWFAGLGVSEGRFRERVYIGAVCRCFPGKAPSGGDRVPSPSEIAACAPWREAELAGNDPELLIPVGKLAISQWLPGMALVDAVGRAHRVEVAGRPRDVVPLPHPSGASTWFRTSPGKERLAEALAVLGAHPVWRESVA